MIKNRISAPIFVLGASKSGTSLFSTLLDNHKDLFVVPRESHFFQYITGDWVEYRLRRAQPVDRDAPALKAAMVRTVEMLNADDNPLGDRPGFRGYDLERFSDHISKRDFADTRELFGLYMSGLYYALNGVELAPGVRVVEKSVENAEYANVLRWLFPDCRFVHILRNPYATLVALRRFKTERGYPSMATIALSLLNSYYYLFKNQITLDGYMVVRYEDLVSEPEATMRQVAGFLDIEFCPGLLCPSLLGEPWGGNSTSGQTFSGISAGPTTDWQKRINNYEIALVNKIAAPVVAKYGYEAHEVHRSKLWPVRGENPLAYIRNRVLLSLL